MKKKIAVIIFVIFAIALTVFTNVLTHTGDIKVEYGDFSFTVEASFWADITIEYDSVDNIEYRDSNEVGYRIKGVGGEKILAGLFNNKEFGDYTRYSYMDCNACTVVSVDGKIVVISGKDTESTRKIYSELLLRIDE